MGIGLYLCSHQECVNLLVCAVKSWDSWTHLLLCSLHLCDNPLKPRKEALEFVDFFINIVCVLFASLIPFLEIRISLEILIAFSRISVNGA